MSLLTTGLNLGTTLLHIRYTLNGLGFECDSMNYNGSNIITEKKVPSSNFNFSSYLYKNPAVIEILGVRFNVLEKLGGNGFKRFIGGNNLAIIELLNSLQTSIPIVLTTPVFTKLVKIESFKVSQSASNTQQWGDITFREEPIIAPLDTTLSNDYTEVENVIPIEDRIFFTGF